MRLIVSRAERGAQSAPLGVRSACVRRVCLRRCPPLQGIGCMCVYLCLHQPSSYQWALAHVGADTPVRDAVKEGTRTHTRTSKIRASLCTLGRGLFIVQQCGVHTQLPRHTSAESRKQATGPRSRKLGAPAPLCLLVCSLSPSHHRHKVIMQPVRGAICWPARLVCA